MITIPIFLAVDQGGTKTDVLIADDKGNIKGFGNDRDWLPVQGERRHVRMIRLRHAADKAIKEASLSYGDIDFISAGCIGADWEFEYEIGRNNIRKTFGIENVELYNDCVGALRGGTEIRGCDCAVLCLGSGANCAVFNREGKMHTYHYYLKGEHQGAHAIGSFIFQAVFDAKAGLGKQTVLTELLLNEAGQVNVDDLHMEITTGLSGNEKPRYPVYKDYAPLLFRAIDLDDEVAIEYLDWLCRELVNYIVIGVKELSIGERDLNVVLSGGVPKSSDSMRRCILYHLQRALPNAQLIDAKYEPVVGALLLGYDKLYTRGTPEKVLDTLEINCAERKLFRRQS